jgi:hypothetical protein
MGQKEWGVKIPEVEIPETSLREVAARMIAGGDEDLEEMLGRVRV